MSADAAAKTVEMAGSTVWPLTGAIPTDCARRKFGACERIRTPKLRITQAL
jgi:hypothetical protein